MSRRTAIARIAAIAAIAVAYVTTAKLGLLLAIPPGYATAIWPPSGIALGALLILGWRYWPGVWLGSFCANIATSYDPSSAASIAQSVALAATIASGASLQAVVGTIFIRRRFGASLRLTNEREILGFFALGGPLACLVNATIGVTGLAIAGAIPLSAMPYSAWTWWVGDTVGVLIFTTPILMWLSGDPAWRGRRVAVTASLAVMFTSAVLVFVYTSRAESRELQARFQEDASNATHTIERHIELHSEMVLALRGLFAASEHVDREEFRRFVAPILANHPEMLALGWAPQEQAETSMLYIETRQNAADLNTDLTVDPQRRTAMEQARASGGIAATAPIRLSPQSANVDGFLLIAPVHRYAANARETTNGDLLGYVVGILRINELIEGIHTDQLVDDRIVLTIEDTQAAAGKRLLFRSTDAASESRRQMDLSTQVQLPVGQRHWLLTFKPPLEYADATVAWLVLAGGLLLSALVGAGALILTGRTAEIEATVRTRTDELAEINKKLFDEIGDHLRTEAELEQQRSFLQMVLDNLHEGLIVFDTEGRTTMANASTHRIHERITGVQGNHHSWMHQHTLYYADGVTPIPPHQLPRARALNGESVADFEMVAKTPGRDPIVLMANSRPLVDANGRTTGALTLIRDLSESRQAERLKREFVSIVSHELRTPLTSIRASLGLVHGGASGPLPAKARHMLDIAYRNTERLVHLINDILDIAKIESGRLSLAMARHPLRTLVEQAIVANGAYAHSVGVRIQLIPPTTDATVNVDANRLAQVMANLLSNAVKFSPSNGVVEVSIEQRAPWVRVCVRDRGPGIPADFQPMIFQKFCQADASDARAKPGTGLGLAISKALIEQMSGTIGYTTAAGAGTVFFFDLPQHDAAASAQSASAG
jgi:signal transduction histidine kinase/CHASE1-domain containing sensor protein